uniref:Uncharacterized protein n=1 Tax=Knipowitschia caucasica TaxID=637954 RepID=A0AAV2JV22_KNICA
MSRGYLIAIDFGTSYSGHVYSIAPRGAELVPNLRRWGQEYGHNTPKTPTCILFDANGKFMHFEYKAKDKYLEMDKDDAAKNYFFENFKMELHNKKITKDLTIKDVKKRPMSALKVFSAALRFLKDDALKTIFMRTSEGAEDGSPSVPDFIKNLLREKLDLPQSLDLTIDIAHRSLGLKPPPEAPPRSVAGIVSSSSQDKLVIALEPEAALVWCKKLPCDGFITEEHEGAALQQTPGTQYVLWTVESSLRRQFCVSGGTINITVHEVLEGGALKELHKASGNDKGGRRVNKRFNQCLREFFCGGLWEDYEREFPKDVQTFVEDSIYHAAPQSRVYKTHIDRSLRQKLKRIEKSQEEGGSLFKPMEGVELEGDKLSVSEKKMKSFFHESLVHITDSLCEILDSHSQIQYILLVGGFSQSRILCGHVRQQFSDRARVLCPKNPQEAILKGAVVFARDQAVIRSRKSAFTYGVKISVRYDKSKHKSKFTNKEGDWCNVMFYKLVGIDEDVGWDETRKYTFIEPCT